MAANTAANTSAGTNSSGRRLCIRRLCIFATLRLKVIKARGLRSAPLDVKADSCWQRKMKVGQRRKKIRLRLPDFHSPLRNESLHDHNRHFSRYCQSTFRARPRRRLDFRRGYLTHSSSQPDRDLSPRHPCLQLLDRPNLVGIGLRLICRRVLPQSPSLHLTPRRRSASPRRCGDVTCEIHC